MATDDGSDVVVTIEFRNSTRQVTPADLHQAQHRQHVLRTELPRVRPAALAWRNGLAALLAGLVGFGLVKGRSDVSGLDEHWAAAVGGLLLTALLLGASAAVWLMSAAHGLPRVLAVDRLPSRTAADHDEAVRSAKRLRRGIGATFGCAAALVAAVGATWYGPPLLPVCVSPPRGVFCARRCGSGPRARCSPTPTGTSYDTSLPGPPRGSASRARRGSRAGPAGRSGPTHRHRARGLGNLSPNVRPLHGRWRSGRPPCRLRPIGP
ncbi:hypothetical protein [Streptomyces sp. NPDC058398]|uniref:hypothetical protein n=1 Tax=Streptomyces sp. NPDC058398 TaxID=3346479 RepID=UPI003668F866